MPYTIEVVEYQGERLFSYTEDEETPPIRFDTLHAYHEFDGGEMAVIRGDAELCRSPLKYYGTHGACTCFINLSYEFTRTGGAVTSIRAVDFQVGDRLDLSTKPGRELGGSFADLMRSMHLISQIIRDEVPVQGPGVEGISLGQLQLKVYEALVQEEQAKAPEVLRFR